MKSYAIYDENDNGKTIIGYLLYYEKSENFIIELNENLSEWEVPLLFQGLVKKGIYTVPADISLMWVRERVIPSGRQNIGSILKTHKLKDYNEMALLALSNGKCSQDSCYISEVKDIPENIKRRMDMNVSECFPTEDYQLVCMFKDNTVRKIEFEKFENKNRDISRILKYKEMFNSVKVGVGGYSVVFNENIEIPVSDLRREGLLLPLSASDFYGFVRRNVVDATKACDMLQCSRQNLSYMVKEGKLEPIICGTKENMYVKGDIEREMNE